LIHERADDKCIENISSTGEIQRDERKRRSSAKIKAIKMLTGRYGVRKKTRLRAENVLKTNVLRSGVDQVHNTGGACVAQYARHD